MILGTLVAMGLGALHAFFIGDVQKMGKTISVVIRDPSQIRFGVASAEELIRERVRTRVVFLCPGCESKKACRSGLAHGEALLAECYTDRPEPCAPCGFRYAEPETITRLISESDIVIPW